MACRRATPRWACRARASPCTPPSPRAREGSPSSTGPTRTTTCRPRPSHVTPPLRAKGEASRRSEAKRVMDAKRCFIMFLWEEVHAFICSYFKQAHSRGLHCHTFCPSECCRHAANVFSINIYLYILEGLILMFFFFFFFRCWPVCAQCEATSPFSPTSPHQQSSQYHGLLAHLLAAC